MGRYIEEDADGNRYIVDDGGDAATPPYQLGPDYNQSVGGNARKGFADMPEAAYRLGSDVVGLASAPAPQEDISGALSRGLRAGLGGGLLGNIPSNIYDAFTSNPERGLRTVGGMAAGTAGAEALGAAGAAGGTMIWPGVGTVVGGLGGAALGFGGGLLGFDMTTDALTGSPDGIKQSLLDWYNGKGKSENQYLKDLAYNSSQAIPFGMAHSAVTKGAPALKTAPQGAPTEARVAAAIEKVAPDYANQIDTALQAGQGDPFLQNKSLGELLDNPQLMNLERGLARSDPSLYAKSAERNASRNDSQLRWLDNIEAPGPGASDVQSSIQEGAANNLAAGRRGVSAAEDVVKGKVAELPASINTAEVGATIRGNLNDALTSHDARVKQAFGQMGSGKVDRAPVEAAIDEALQTYFKSVGKQPGPELKSLIDQLKSQGEPILGANGKPMIDEYGQPLTKPVRFTLEEVQAARSQALALGKLDPRSSAVATAIADSLLSAAEDAVRSGSVTPREFASWQKGISLRKMQGDKFESSATPAKSVLAEQAYGRPKLPDSAVPSKYFRPGEIGSPGERGIKEGLDNYKQTIGADDAAMEPLYRYAVDSFRQSGAVGADGLINSRAANAWLKRHSAILSQMPELKAQLSDLHGAQQFLNEKFGDMKRTQAQFESGALKSWLGDVDPQAAIKEMLSGNKMVQRTSELVRHLQANDPAALAGLRRGVIEHLKRNFIPSQMGGVEESLSSGSQFKGDVLGGTLAKEMLRIRPALEKSGLFTQSQLKGFDYLYGDKRSQLSVERAKMPGGSDTAQNATTLATLSKMAGNTFLKVIPYGNYIAAIIKPLLEKMGPTAFEVKLQEALLDPRIARDLQNRPTAKNVSKTATEIFKDELSSAGLGLERLPVANADAKRNLTINKAHEATAKAVFPNVDDIRNPKAPGKVEKTSFSLDKLNPFTASTAEASDNLTIDDINRANADMARGRGLSAETRARISVESNGNPDAISPKGAQGLSQLMPATGRWIGQQLNEPYQPLTKNMTAEQRQASIEQNIRFGDWYFRKLEEDFKDKTLARAAYNAGPARVRAAMKAAGTRDVNTILRSLPRGVQKETLPYVEKIAQRYGKG